MAILVWPQELLPASQTFRILSNGTSFTSPWTGSTQTMRFPGSRWSTVMQFDNLDDYESRLLETMLAKLDGMSGRVYLRDFGRVDAIVSGNPVVDGSGQSGTSVITKGWAASKKVLGRGDYIKIGNELKMVVDDVVSNGTGAATINIGPMLRYSPADSTPIVLDNPMGVFMQAGNENGWDRKPAFATNFSLEFVEAFP